jgi:hypothetical protein
MISIEDEVNKHRNCRERDKLEVIIKDYKNLALQYAQNIVLAGRYNMVALKLQEICDKLPAQNLKRPASKAQNVPVKTADITSAENARIKAEWDQKAGSPRSGGKR